MATVSIPLTCGELVQGLWEGLPALVSCPIDLYSTAHLTLANTWQLPEDTSKTNAAIQMAGERFVYTGGGKIELESATPRGRGYGTSTADIASCLYAFGCATRNEFTPATVAEMAVSIEPTDSTIFPGLTLFDHRQGAFHHTWGAAPPLHIILLDPGGAVDTIRFNQLDHQKFLEKQASIHQEAFLILRSSLESANWDAFGQAATLSAQAHQVILNNPLLNEAFQLADQIRALGVCRAHSGTIIGLIIDPEKENTEEAATYVATQLPSSVKISCHRIVDGGPIYQSNKIGEHHVTARYYFENPTFR